MSDIKEVLRKLEAHDMHVHIIDNETPLPVSITPIDTHFIMKGADIVHVGNITTIERFAIQQEEEGGLGDE